MFGDVYRKLERGGAAEREHRAARMLIDRIFMELRASTRELEVGAFLDELHELCRARLEADVRHFAAKRQVRHSDARAAKLEDQRYFTGRLPPRAVTTLRDVAEPALVELRANAARGRATREELSINRGSVPRQLTRLLDAEFEATGVNAAVSAYEGRSMGVVGVGLELSIPTSTWWRDHHGFGQAPRTLYVHSDEGLEPKSIVYLTDVTAREGPTSVYPNAETELGLEPLQKLIGRVINNLGTAPSSRLHALYDRVHAPRAFESPIFRRHFAMLPRALRYNSHFGWDVIPNSTLENALVAKEVPLVGPAGSYVVFDGARLLHRGGLLDAGERVVLQVILWERRSRVINVASRLINRGRDAVRGNAWRDDVRHARTALGKLARDVSPAPKHRLAREISGMLPPVGCVDIGASYYPHPPWDVFRRSPSTRWLAIEPNEANTKYAQTWRWPSRIRVVPIGLSEHGGAHSLHVTNVDSGSSLLPPVINADMEHRVHNHSYFFPLTEKTIATCSLTELVTAELDASLPLIVKLDTQGTELAILRGASSLLATRRVVGVETEATLLANPIMVGSGKFWEVCQFLESHGFELLQLRPIEGGSARSTGPRGRTYLNECDAVFCLRRSELARLSTAHQLTALGFYVAYELYDEARALYPTIALPTEARERLHELLG
jgi:FkbM family methyltransferase